MAISGRDQYLTEVILSLRDNLSREGAKADATLDRLDASTDELTRSFSQADASAGRFSLGLKNLGLQALALNEIRGLVLSLISPLQTVGELSDVWKEMSARVGIFTKDVTQVPAIMARIGQIAQESRTPIAEIGKLYARLAQGLSENNVSQGTLLSTVQALSDALLISGASSAEATGAIMQFSQAMASGTLRGEEFNSVAEQAPLLLDALAAQLKVTKGELRGMAADGKITTDVLLKAIAGASDQWRDQAKQIPLTIGRAMENLKSAMTVYLGQNENAQISTAAFANSIQYLSDNLMSLGAAARDAGMIALIAAMSRGVGVVGAWTASTVAANMANKEFSVSTILRTEAGNKAAAAEAKAAAALAYSEKLTKAATASQAEYAAAQLQRAKGAAWAAEIDVEHTASALRLSAALTQSAKAEVANALAAKESALASIAADAAAAQSALARLKQAVSTRAQTAAEIELAAARETAAVAGEKAQSTELGRMAVAAQAARVAKETAAAEVVVAENRLLIARASGGATRAEELLAAARQRLQIATTAAANTEGTYTAALQANAVAQFEARAKAAAAAEKAAAAEIQLAENRVLVARQSGGVETAEIKLAAARNAHGIAAGNTAIAERNLAEAQAIAARAAQQAAAAEVARLEALVAAQGPGQVNAALTNELSIARSSLRISTDGLALANGRLAVAEERQAAAIFRSIDLAAKLTAERVALTEATLAHTAAELANTKAISASIIANRAGPGIMARAAEGIKGMMSAQNLLNAAMAVFIGYEIGKYLTEWALTAETTSAGLNKLRDVFAGLNADYAIFREGQKVDIQAQRDLAKQLTEIEKATGLVLKSREEINAAYRSGALLVNQEISNGRVLNTTYEKGVAVISQQVEGMGNLDSAYARTLKTLESFDKSIKTVNASREQELEGHAKAAAAYGKEEESLQLLADAKRAAITTAERDLENAKTAAAIADRRVESLERENAARGILSPALKEHVQKIANEAEAYRLAVEQAERNLEAKKAEAVAAGVASKTFGDQTDALKGLLEQQTALGREADRLKKIRDAGVLSEQMYAGALAESNAAVKAQAEAMDLGFGVTEEQATETKYLAGVVTDLERSMRAGTAAAAAMLTVQEKQRDLAPLIADAARDSAKSIEIEMHANERALTIEQARLALATDQAHRLIQMATLRGDDAEALRLSTRELYAEAEAARLAGEAKSRDAALLTERARLMEIAGKATGDYTREERDLVDTTRDAAEMAGIEAERLKVNAAIKRTAAIEAANLAEQTERVRRAFDDAGVSGVRSMDDVRAAISRAATGPELAALAAGLQAAIQAGVDKAGELSTALAEVQAKMDGLESKTRRASVSYEEIFKQYGTDTGRYRKSALAGLTGEQGQQAVDAYEAWLREQGFGGGAQAKSRDQMTAREVAQAAASSPAAAQTGYRRVVDINLRGAGETATVTAASEDEAERVIRVLRAAQRGAT